MREHALFHKSLLLTLRQFCCACKTLCAAATPSVHHRGAEGNATVLHNDKLEPHKQGGDPDLSWIRSCAVARNHASLQWQETHRVTMTDAHLGSRVEKSGKLELEAHARASSVMVAWTALHAMLPYESQAANVLSRPRSVYVWQECRGRSRDVLHKMCVKSVAEGCALTAV